MRHVYSHINFVYSSLLDAPISDEDSRYCKDVSIRHGMQTVRDFFINYNNTDVGPFLTALDRQIEVYRRLEVDLLKDRMSLPEITLKYLNMYRVRISSLFDHDQGELHSPP